MFYVGFILGFAAAIAWVVVSFAVGVWVGPKFKRRSRL